MRTIALLLALIVPLTANAFSLKTHVYFANQIHQKLVELGKGPYYLELMTPSGQPGHRIPITTKDAQAIVDNLLYFRGGVVGPDDTVMTKLTDLTHAPQYRPFQQCEALYDEAIKREADRVRIDGKVGAERAYALGCFVHGIGDNVLHHLVNTLSGETFTFTPKPDPGSTQQPSKYSNMERHMVAEQPYDAVPITNPAELEHKLAKELIQRVYFDPDNTTETGLWARFTEQLVAGKKEALRKALGIAPGLDISQAIIDAKGDDTDIEKPWSTDIKAVEAYAGYLKDHIDPVHAFLMLPEIVRDVKNLYRIINEQGRYRAENISRLFFVRKPMLNNAFVTIWPEENSDGANKTRFERRMDEKFKALDDLIPAYLNVVERLSNIDIKNNIFDDPESSLVAFGELVITIDRIKEIDTSIFFSPKAQDFFDLIHLDWLLSALGKIFDLATDKIKKLVINRVKDEIAKIAAELKVEKARAQDDVQTKRGELHTKLDLFDVPFLDSVLYLNAYNSSVAVLADRNVVVDTERPFFLGEQTYRDGPVSFDASYQLEYNQLALCDEKYPNNNYRDAFYPCGITTGEMLQPMFGCTRLDTVVEPFEECHLNDSQRYAEPSLASCHTVSIEAFEDEVTGGTGSWSMSYRWVNADPSEQPSCRLSTLFTGRGDGDYGKSDGFGIIDEQSGCSVGSGAGADASTLAPPLLALLLLLGLVIRRRRR